VNGYARFIPLVGLALAACVQRADGQRGVAPPVAALGPGEAVVLWCDRVSGDKCSVARGILDVRPLGRAQLAGSEWEAVAQTPTECDAPGVAGLVERLGGALGIDPRSWHDTLNDQLRGRPVPSQLVGTGCTNCCGDLSEAPVRINVVERAGSRLYLIRVWERVRPEFMP
jgi:hypothetical protein